MSTIIEKLLLLALDVKDGCDTVTQRLAVDIGGTFVDSVLFDREEKTLETEKSSTTPANPSRGVINAVGKTQSDLDEVETFVHGTTLGINAFLEREGAEVGIITNEGFKDVYEMGRTRIPTKMRYDPNYTREELLVPRRQRVGVPGRMNADGEVIEPLDEQAVRDAVQYLVDEQEVEAIVVCFLHSYQNNEHEQAAAEIIADEYPNIPTSISTDITGQYREYERMSTTVLDAYIKPVFKDYVNELHRAIKGMDFDGSFFVTRSGGGVIPAAEAQTAPIETILSGPAGGIIGGSYVADLTGHENLITVDVGGTSMDACVINNSEPEVERETSLENHPLLISVYDLQTIGQGGGSIAWLDENLLKVGPESAGAVPGPICYGKGGTEPTVTDAALELGYLDDEYFLGGGMDLETKKAHRNIKKKLADPLDQSTTKTSADIFKIMAANTVGALREITVQKGFDPRNFSILSYGGAGGMFTPLLQRDMDVNQLIVPQAPSVFSSWGMLMANDTFDFSQTFLRELTQIEITDVEAQFEQLEAEATENLTESGYSPDRQRFVRSLDMQYSGQEHNVEVEIDNLDSLESLHEQFEQMHERRYGHRHDADAKIVNARIRGIGLQEKPEIKRVEEGSGKEDAVIGTQEAYCFAKDERTDFDVYSRDPLAAGDVLPGPAIIREPTTTIVYHSDQQAEIDEYGHIIINDNER